MAFQATDEEGAFLVKLARKAVEAFLKDGQTISTPSDAPPRLTNRSGVFVTLNILEGNKKRLRGCIGYPYPTTKLAQATIECALSAAFRDPRFHPLSHEELDRAVFEVSVLSSPQQIKSKDVKSLPSEIKVGRDGLIVENGHFKGLLLPQVPVEYDWDEEDFLSQCCVKAGLPPDCWLLKTSRVFQFQAVVFEEESPGGRIKRKRLGGK